MDAYNLSVARENIAKAIALLEQTVPVLQDAEASHLAEELARTLSMVHCDYRLVTDAWRRAKATAFAGGA